MLVHCPCRPKNTEEPRNRNYIVVTKTNLSLFAPSKILEPYPDAPERSDEVVSVRNWVRVDRIKEQWKNGNSLQGNTLYDTLSLIL